MNNIIAYKLFRKMNDGQLAPLFINKKMRIPIGIWLDAELHPTNGYAVRKGWHCTLFPNAPHLTTKNRVWAEVEITNIEYYERPESQGGKWVVAQKMKVIRELDSNDIIIAKWKHLGLLDGLIGNVEESVSKMFESKLTQKIKL